MRNFSNLSDHELTQLLKKGESAAFTEIYNRYIDSLVGFAGSKLHRLEDAHDILHDIFVKLWEDRQYLYGSRSYGSYVFQEVKAQWSNPVNVAMGLTAFAHGMVGIVGNNAVKTLNPYQLEETHGLLSREKEWLNLKQI